MARIASTPTRVRTPQQERSRQKVASLLEAARRCFSTLGYADTTMAHIAREARVSIGTAYAYFKDKDAVLRCILQEHAAVVLQPAEAMMAALPAKATLRDTLEKMTKGSVVFRKEQAGLHRVFLERVLKDPKLHSIAAKFREAGLAVGKRMAEQFGGPRAKRDIEATAQVFIGLFEYCANIGTVYASPVTRERAVRVAINMIAAYFEE